jgi:hypothetical protein
MGLRCIVVELHETEVDELIRRVLGVATLSPANRPECIGSDTSAFANGKIRRWKKASSY